MDRRDRAQWARLPAVAAICAALLLLSVQFGALAGARPEPVEQMAALVARESDREEPVGTYQAFVRNLVFYTRFKQVDLYDEGRRAQLPQVAGARAARDARGRPAAAASHRRRVTCQADSARCST